MVNGKVVKIESTKIENTKADCFFCKVTASVYNGKTWMCFDCNKNHAKASDEIKDLKKEICRLLDKHKALLENDKIFLGKGHVNLFLGLTEKADREETRWPTKEKRITPTPPLILMPMAESPKDASS